ncbi:DUF1648 domain-containing protein [Brevibacterium aurantiacum]|uniref:DUF1648 domain-containing protein n=1 Tax=Brevibacterium aurantiacum TaxID=273384 RepID=A0A2H1JHH8_BREAU|nr:DUF1648 domain-containing protein [Brevibacterium aurantiacum]AZT92367.1 DUF1648 domain-containing protein [Brevibacterium aurantiacum]MDN5735310.1 DUF1648 domain-containing protein [Brevibacterium aurantiacum]MDN5738464.1 DUF1648 domain-containing protein [Brevibacterium aurantiacum]MDN5774899.1 DUF1648 domain-containing protein [Brevibacterium aurantiacum]PCC53250.1 DUF1648 domain-containing protein [Brevibacterium aurantiacum]
MVGHDNYATNYVTGTLTKWVRRSTLLATGVLSAVLLAGYPFLPDLIPTHFDLAGRADSYGPSWTLFVLVGLLCVLIAATSWLSTRPQMLNFPVVVTAENAQSVFRESERMMVWVSAALFIVYVGTAISVWGGYGAPFFLAGILGLATATILGVKRTLSAG